jgi:hypothetical protein
LHQGLTLTPGISDGSDGDKQIMLEDCRDLASGLATIASLWVLLELPPTDRLLA